MCFLNIRYPYGLHWLSPLSQGNIFIRGGVTLDRENPSLDIDSLGRGVLTFNVLAVNDAPTDSFTATATVCHMTSISLHLFVNEFVISCALPPTCITML